MSKRFRLVLIVIALIVAGVFLYPTIYWYFFVSEDDRALANNSRSQIREYAIDSTRADIAELRASAAEDAGGEIPARFLHLEQNATENLRAENRDLPEVWTIGDLLGAFRGEDELFTTLEEYYRLRVDDLKQLKTRIIQPGLDLSGGVFVILEADEQSLADRLGETPARVQVDEAIDLAVSILTGRIDRFGITEPQIRRIGDNRVSIEIPGEDDRERVNSFLVGKGRLNFHVVDVDATRELIDYQTSNLDWNPATDAPPDFVRVGSQVSEYVTRDQYGIDRGVRHIVIKEDVVENGLDGAHITEAQSARDPITGQPLVNFVLDGEGSDIFARLTRDNVGGSIAIVLDEQVRAYATIPEEIPTGQVRISGFSEDESRDIANVLRTAALPIDLGVVNQQRIGAQLGQQTIDTGLRAIALGFILVVVFMLIYYKGAGVVANVMLLLNLFFIVSILSVFNLTLTLTGIAGIILTVGMAVDANVIIFERMKEEYRLGKSPRASVKAGFQKAFWTIIDANVTTFIAALFLSQFGSGPIQGFAVTLSVGIVTSMFTALVVSRLIFEFTTEVLRRPRLSISWSKQ